MYAGLAVCTKVNDAARSFPPKPSTPPPKPERVDRCGNEQQLERLLAASFPYLIIPELRPIPERIIGKLRRVPARFLDRLVAKPHILDDLPMRVKQQVRGVGGNVYVHI